MVVATITGPPRIALSDRDRRIIQCAREKLRGRRVDFGDAVRALREAVEEAIPDGRVFLLGTTAAGPIVGSIISGVGITESAAGVQLVRTTPSRPLEWLARFLP